MDAAASKPTTRFLGRETLVHVGVRGLGGALAGVLLCLTSRELTGFPFTPPFTAALLGLFGGALLLVPILIERWRTSRAVTGPWRDAALALGTALGVWLLYVPTVLQAFYGGGVIEEGGPDGGVAMALYWAEVIWDQLGGYLALGLAHATGMAWFLWVGLRFRHRVGRVALAAAGGWLVTWLPLTLPGVHHHPRLCLPLMFAVQGVAFFALRHAAHAITGEEDPAGPRA